MQELFRRIEPSKRSIGSFLKMEVFDPLGLNISIGLDEENQKKTKIADNVALTPQEVLELSLKICIHPSTKSSLDIPSIVGYIYYYLISCRDATDLLLLETGVAVSMN